MAEANVVCLESKDRISSLSFLQRSIISSFWSQISLPPRDHQKRFLWEAPKFIEPGHPFSERRFQTVSRSIQNSRVQSKGPVVPLTLTHGTRFSRAPVKEANLARDSCPIRAPRKTCKIRFFFFYWPKGFQIPCQVTVVHHCRTAAKRCQQRTWYE
jgi:hypothetical protein